LPQSSALPPDSKPDAQPTASVSRPNSTTSLRAVGEVLWRRRLLASSILGGLLLLCLLYCLVAPNQYEATAEVALRTSPAAPLGLEAAEPMAAASILSAPLQLETLANVLRSEQLAWKVIGEVKLYAAPVFYGRFAQRFPDFKIDAPTPEAREYLLDRFARRLHVQTVPRSLVIQIRFRSKDAALSAAVVNALIRAYGQQEGEARVEATAEATNWLQSQLKSLKAQVDQQDQKLAAFQKQHGIVSQPDIMANGQQGESQHSSTLKQIDELGPQLVAATTERILRESEFHAASMGNPELVLASDTRLEAESGGLATAVLEQIRARHSALEEEQAQLSAEHGPNFPRVVEIRRQLDDLDAQKKAEDAKLVERFRSAWTTAQEREQMVRKSLEDATAEGMAENQAATEYAVMRQEANSSHDVYLRVKEKVEQAGLVAGVHASSISVVDAARQPAKPVAPDLPVYIAITFFAGLWLAVGGVLMVESWTKNGARTAALVLVALLAGAAAQGQPPSPNLNGVPPGISHFPPATQPSNLPSAKEAPTVWDNPAAAGQAGLPPLATALSNAPMAAPIGPGDALEITESHTPEFHSAVRVSTNGTVTLPMLGEVDLLGLDERGAALAIEKALVGKGMLLHPQVTVLVTGYAGQDVSVLGEVTRPGVYPYTLHHRLLDLISAASGMAPSAGRLVNIYHRSDAQTAHAVVLDPGGTDTGNDHNPELLPGDTVQVSRAGLVYVIGDVVRPGGFPVDPAQGLTVVQALSLAWGTTLNAGSAKALLIHEQKGGRTMTTLNLGRMMHGKDQDQPIHDRDILYVPHSLAKELAAKALESAIQSAVGLSIYSGLVYSQWRTVSTTATSVANSTTSTTGTGTAGTTTTTTTTTSK
jgi:uncharacterized protein involved in exopolysaccharide biosynthesis/protein involved in polysaccharide export with SLBB domain